MGIYVNLGCGQHFHPDWINFDIVSLDNNVIVHDLTSGIPLPDNHADIVYHSHVLEHIRPQYVSSFLGECYRVLKPGGIIRVVVPDLEQICRLYLATLEEAIENKSGANDRYNWLLLEMYDQTIREQSGGRMAEFLSQIPLPAEGFVFQRSGEEARQLVQQLRATNTNDNPNHILTQLMKLNRKRLWQILRKQYTKFISQFLLGKHAQRALEIGLFRLGGEVHQWMYDRFSLSQLLCETGFSNPTRQSADESHIIGWEKFHLDTMTDGSIYKPDSLYMEAQKPA